ncbi:MAG: chemotaxis protein CheW [Saccharofermentanales bacterium]
MKKTYLSLKINDNLYLLDTNYVINIDNYPNINKVPGLSNDIIGMINFRGKPILLFDIHKILNLNDNNSKSNTIIVKLKNNKDIAIIVDDVLSVIDIDTNNIVNKMDNYYIGGIIEIDNKLMMVLDINKIIN